jgi:hypothetical protein
LVHGHDRFGSVAVAQKVFTKCHKQIAGGELLRAAIWRADPTGASLDHVKPRETVRWHAERPLARQLESAVHAPLHLQCAHDLSECVGAVQLQ